MSLIEDIAFLPLATLLDCREHYERALRWERSPIRQAICIHTLHLINKELTRRMPPTGEPLLLPKLPALSLPCPLQ